MAKGLRQVTNRFIVRLQQKLGSSLGNNQEISKDRKKNLFLLSCVHGYRAYTNARSPPCFPSLRVFQVHLLRTPKSLNPPNRKGMLERVRWAKTYGVQARAR